MVLQKVELEADKQTDGLTLIYLRQHWVYTVKIQRLHENTTHTGVSLAVPRH